MPFDSIENRVSTNGKSTFKYKRDRVTSDRSREENFSYNRATSRLLRTTNGAARTEAIEPNGTLFLPVPTSYQSARHRNSFQGERVQAKKLIFSGKKQTNRKNVHISDRYQTQKKIFMRLIGKMSFKEKDEDEDKKRKKRSTAHIFFITEYLPKMNHGQCIQFVIELSTVQCIGHNLDIIISSN